MNKCSIILCKIVLHSELLKSKLRIVVCVVLTASFDGVDVGVVVDDDDDEDEDEESASLVSIYCWCGGLNGIYMLRLAEYESRKILFGTKLANNTAAVNRMFVCL
jgi:hypothetical protein